MSDAWSTLGLPALFSLSAAARIQHLSPPDSDKITAASLSVPIVCVLCGEDVRPSRRSWEMVRSDTCGH